MTPIHDDNLTFEQKVLISLAGLETKMDILVGEDGNSGRLANHSGRLKVLEDFRSRWKGALGVLLGLAAVGGTIVGVIALFKH